MFMHTHIQSVTTLSCKRNSLTICLHTAMEGFWFAVRSAAARPLQLMSTWLASLWSSGWRSTRTWVPSGASCRQDTDTHSCSLACPREWLLWRWPAWLAWALSAARRQSGPSCWKRNKGERRSAQRKGLRSQSSRDRNIPESWGAVQNLVRALCSPLRLD